MANDRGLLLAREREHELALAALLQPALERAQLGVAVTLGARDQLLVHVVELENGRGNLADERRHMPTSEPLHRHTPWSRSIRSVSDGRVRVIASRRRRAYRQPVRSVDHRSSRRQRQAEHDRTLVQQMRQALRDEGLRMLKVGSHAHTQAMHVQHAVEATGEHHLSLEAAQPTTDVVELLALRLREIEARMEERALQHERQVDDTLQPQLELDAPIRETLSIESVREQARRPAGIASDPCIVAFNRLVGSMVQSIPDSMEIGG